MNLFNSSGRKSFATTIRRWCHSVDWLVYWLTEWSLSVFWALHFYKKSTWMKCNFLNRVFWRSDGVKLWYLLLFKLISSSSEPEPPRVSVCSDFTSSGRSAPQKPVSPPACSTWSCDHMTHIRSLHITHEEETHQQTPPVMWPQLQRSPSMHLF